MRIYTYDYYEKNIIRPRANESIEDLMDEIQKEVNDNLQIFEISKKKGSRQIYYFEKENNKELTIEKTQRKLLKNLLNTIVLPSVVKGFKKQYGYNDYLKEHQNSKFFLHLDIKDFFDSITYEQVNNALGDFIENSEDKEKIIENIISLCMYTDDKKKILPQGWITSPMLSNLVFRRIDQCILKYSQCIKKVEGLDEDIIYTRYADDLLFSSKHLDFSKKMFFEKKIRYILKNNGFMCNSKKTIRTSDSIFLKGYVLSKDVHLSRNKLKCINNIIYYFDKRTTLEKKYKVNKEKANNKMAYKELNELLKSNKAKVFLNNEQVIQYLCGYRAYLISIIKVNGTDTENIKVLKRKVNHIQMIVDSMSTTEV